MDRDGVINEDSDLYVKSAEEWQPISGSIDAMANLTQSGYLVAIATNQSGLARGLFSEKELTDMHEKMIQLVDHAGGKISSIQFCPHHPDDGCACRKPKPGMPMTILKELNVQPENSWFVGDTLKDIQSGKKAGCKTALVKTGKGLQALTKGEGLEDTLVFDNLAEFCNYIIKIGF